MRGQTNGQTGAVFSNRSFIDDDSNPPSYHSIYPSAMASSQDDSKEQKPSSSGATSNLVANLFQNTSHGSQEPISYDQLYSPAASQFLYSGDGFSLPSTIVVQHRLPPPRIIPPPINTINNQVRKQFHQIFTKGYLLKHFIFISVSSMMIILFQIILINNQSILSHLAAGLWCGLANLFTLLITIITLRYAKVWLLIITIILHFMCLTVSLGSFVVINSVAASRYGACQSFYNPFYEHVIYEQHQLVDKPSANNCLGSNFKYANIAMIILGASCMVMFVSFFIKLVSAFNNIHSSREP